MIIKYFVLSNSHIIQRIVADKETDTHIHYNGNRYKKDDPHSNYFDSFDDAKSFVLDYLHRKQSIAATHLHKVNTLIEKIIDLKETDV